MMITVTIFQTASGEYKGFRSRGHAGYAAHGQDIVCAAVSVLVINTLNAIEALTQDRERMEISEDERKGLIDCRFTGRISDETRLLLDAMVLGLKDVGKQYSKQYIKLQFEEV